MKRFFAWILVLLLLAGCSQSSQPDGETVKEKSANGLTWEEVQPGLAWVEVHPVFQGSEKNLLLVKVDPKKFEFSLFENKNMAKAKTLQEISREVKAPLVFNGAFFDEKFKPLTFLKTGKKVSHKVSKAKLVDGIFGFSQDGIAKLYDPKSFTADDEKSLSFAVQNGPVLLDEKGEVKVQADRGGPAARTAIGLDAEGNIIIFLLRVSVLDSENTMLLTDFATLLKNDKVMKKLGLHSVLNLDGGASSGLVIGEKYYPEMNKVQNAVVVKPK